MFEPNSGIRNWPKNLETLRAPSAVLYGPPQLTRFAAEILRVSGGLTVLGRLFHAEQVEFQPGQSSFHGLQADEVKLRDYDRALYPTRILSRCTGFPVFELCPGDDPSLEKLALENEKHFIAIPLLPGGRVPAWRFLFWYLALPEQQRAVIDTAGDRFDRLRRTEEAAAKHFGKKYVMSIEKMLFGPACSKSLVFSGPALPPDPVWKDALRFLHGGQIAPLLGSLDKVAEIFAKQEWKTLAPVFAEQAEGLAIRHG